MCNNTKEMKLGESCQMFICSNVSNVQAFKFQTRGNPEIVHKSLKQSHTFFTWCENWNRVLERLLNIG